MRQSQFKHGVLICLLMLCSLLTGASVASAQRQEQTSTTSTTLNEDVDLEVQLQLVVASNGAGEGAKLSPQLEAAIRPLRTTLPYSNYRWAATFINRVTNGAHTITKGIAGPLLGTTPPTSSVPSFYEVSFTDVILAPSGTRPQLVHFKLHFGARLPVMVGGGGSNTAQAVNYENTGITTSLSIPENQPVIVGTMNLGASNDMLVLVISVKKIS
ncbi:MAG TPA: hypothetical protein VIW80_04065 [Pyrinomonadaceae bacterium]